MNEIASQIRKFNLLYYLMNNNYILILYYCYFLQTYNEVTAGLKGPKLYFELINDFLLLKTCKKCGYICMHAHKYLPIVILFFIFQGRNAACTRTYIRCCYQSILVQLFSPIASYIENFFHNNIYKSNVPCSIIALQK